MHENFNTKIASLYLVWLKKIKNVIANNSIINCFQFLIWTFCSNYIHTESLQVTFPQVFSICIFFSKLTSKSPQAHTVSIYFSQSVTEGLWESHRKLSSFSQQVIDITPQISSSSGKMEYYYSHRKVLIWICRPHWIFLIENNENKYPQL